VLIILGNFVILDMIQDYLNQCASCSVEDLCCSALISVNDCSEQLSISRDKLIIFIIHEDHFDVDAKDGIPIPAKDRLPLIPIDIEEAIKVVFKDYTSEIQS
jgi:hypothetical protein